MVTHMVTTCGSLYGYYVVIHMLIHMVVTYGKPHGYYVVYHVWIPYVEPSGYLKWYTTWLLCGNTCGFHMANHVVTIHGMTMW